MNMKNPNSEDQVPGNQPMEFRCLEVVSEVIGTSGLCIADAELLENALNDLHDEASSTKRQIVSLQVHTTALNARQIVYTIQAQWIGIETLKDLARRNVLAAGLNSQSGPRGIV